VSFRGKVETENPVQFNADWREKGIHLIGSEFSSPVAIYDCVQILLDDYDALLGLLSNCLLDAGPAADPTVNLDTSVERISLQRVKLEFLRPIDRTSKDLVSAKVPRQRPRGVIISRGSNQDAGQTPGDTVYDTKIPGKKIGRQSQALRELDLRPPLGRHCSNHIKPIRTRLKDCQTIFTTEYCARNF